MKAPDETKQIRQFSVAMAVFLCVLGTVALIKGSGSYAVLYSVSVAFLVVGLAFPPAVKPVFRLWMKLARALGWLNTRLLLGLVFYLVFTPVALVFRVFRVDMLDRKIEPERKSYWHPRQSQDLKPEDYDRQF